MTNPALPRRAAVAAGLTLPAAAMAQTAGAPASVAIVRRWLDEVLRANAPIEGQAHADIVMELHGGGAHPDGTPRILRGLPEVKVWFEKVRASLAAQVTMRVDEIVAQGDVVAVRGENILTKRVEGGAARSRVQAMAAFYTIKDGKIARIVRFTDRLGRTPA